MGISLGIHGRNRAAQVTPMRMAAPLVLTALAFVAALGCSIERGKESAAAQGGGDSKAAAATQRGGDLKATAEVAAKHRAKAGETGAPRQAAKSTAPSNHVRLVQKRCVEFEPHWTTITVGQSLTWHSELASQATIHVSPGAFDKTEYVVRAGSTVSTGPARSQGSFTLWTEPAACQGVARGVQGSGPGLTVEAAAN